MRQIARREDIRDLILDAAEVLLSRYGYRKMTMDDLAQQVGIGKGTIYLHFPSKEEVTLSHIDRIAERVLDEMERVAQEQIKEELRIKKMLLTRVLLRFDSVTNYSQNLDDLLSLLRKPLLARREIHFAKEIKLLARVLEQGRDSGRFHYSSTSIVSRSFILATNSFLPYSLTPAELGRRKEVERNVATIADLMISGLMRKKLLIPSGGSYVC